VRPLGVRGHQVGDVLWVLLVFAERFDIDLAEAFEPTMDSVNRRLDSVAG
jgi:NTP pyrophosphatase (non-canonical NTP hydrolase)